MVVISAATNPSTDKNSTKKLRNSSGQSFTDAVREVQQVSDNVRPQLDTACKPCNDVTWITVNTKTS